ncbi:MAG: bacterioferritin [Desulfovibrionaceae bacterium]|nr:bacterioferritin [Desulfovibrionaceae bacterium]
MAVAKKPPLKKARVIDVLNKARSMELFAIMQYMNQHYQLDNQDYGKLANKIRHIAIDEMRHAEMFAERIKELDGEPTTQIEGTLKKGQSLREIYPFDGLIEDNTINQYNAFIKICRDSDDHVSANLFERIIDMEQEHYNYFTDIQDHIRELGDHFIARMADSGDSE